MDRIEKMLKGKDDNGMTTISVKVPKEFATALKAVAKNMDSSRTTLVEAVWYGGWDMFKENYSNYTKDVDGI